MVKISIVVPVYNTEKYLSRCLKTLVNQTKKEIEIIIVNDGSTDKSEEIIQTYLKEYPYKIKYVKKENGGLSDARNYGVKYATGEYISFIDSDDYVDVNLYASLEEEMEQKADLIKFKMIMTNETNNEYTKVNGPIFTSLKGPEAFNKLVFDDMILESSCIYLYKRENFLKNNYLFAQNRYHEDFGITPIIIIKSNKVISTNIYGYYYVRRNFSITKDNNYTKTKKSVYDLLYHYDNIEKQIDLHSIDVKTRNNLVQYYTNAILVASKKLNKSDKKSYILEIKKRKMIKNIKPYSIRTLIKRLLLEINISLYLKWK